MMMWSIGVTVSEMKVMLQGLEVNVSLHCEKVTFWYAEVRV